MNKHINKNRVVKNQCSTVERVEIDAMPADVATGLLLETRCTNPQRKTYMDARAGHFVSTRKPKSIEDRTAGRLKSAKWAQIVKWHARAVKREVQVQHVLSSLNRALDKTKAIVGAGAKIREVLLQRSINAYAMKGSVLQKGITLLEEEIDRRMSFVNRVREVAPSVADGMTKAMARGE
jgi:hypothetical protein